jgi:hypothetical protein
MRLDIEFPGRQAYKSDGGRISIVFDSSQSVPDSQKGPIMRLRLTVALVVTGLLIVPAAATAFQTISVFPTFASRLVVTTAPVVIQFDQSVDPATVTNNTVTVTGVAGVGPSSIVRGALSVQTTLLPNDTVVFTPTGRWVWGQRYVLHVSPSLHDAAGAPFAGALPYGGLFVANIPDNFAMPVYDPNHPFNMLTGSAAMMGYNPLDPESAAQPWDIPGFNATGAWKYTTGADEILVAVIDEGFVSYAQPNLRKAFWLNKGELPLPNVNGVPCKQYDCNGDGVFDVDDYWYDNRLSGHPPYSVQDLIDAFSDGVDHDGNGLANDISGWDFLRGVNNAIGDPNLPLGDHGNGELQLIAAAGDDGIGGAPGVCPHCRILPVRASASLIYDYNRLAAAVRYAASMGARVINFAGVNFTFSQLGQQAILDAHDAGALMVAVTGDEMTYHHWAPAAAERGFAVKCIFALPPVTVGGVYNLDTFAFTESYCTNYGTHSLVAVPAQSGCSSDGAGSTSGMIGLLYSRASELGIDLTADEAKQIMTMTAYDIRDHCASIGSGFGVCQPGFDEHFGYGRPDAEAAIRTLGDPQLGLTEAIPPSVQLLSPSWWQTFDPIATPVIEVQGSISSRTVPYHWQVQVADGREPLENEFRTVDEGDATKPLNGPLASIDLANYFSTAAAAALPTNQYSFTATVRVQASYQTPIGQAVMGEDRKTISVRTDDGLLPGFPYFVGDSGESAPLLYDLDGQGTPAVIFGTGGGRVFALRVGPLGPESLSGFPVDLTGDGQWVADTIFASVAVGDLFHDGSAEIVAATSGGLVYAIDNTGKILPGFPVTADPPDNTSAWNFAFGNGFYASPVLVDLDQDGMLEIVAAAADQKVYAWKPVIGGVQRVPGWPVKARDDSGLIDPGKLCQEQDRPYPILGTPAAGVLDPSDSDPDIGVYPSVVVATNEACADGTSRVYAIYHDGMNNPNGPFLPGWPVAATNPFGGLIPIGWITGAAASPSVLPNATGSTIGIGTVGWFPQQIQYSQRTTKLVTMAVRLAINAIASPAFSSLQFNQQHQYLIPMTGAFRFSELGYQLMNSRVYAIEAEAPNNFVFEGNVEDIPMLASVAAADVDGDGRREVIAGTGGSLIHAFTMTGGEAPGWPKFTGKWNMATPALGDVTGDGKLDVIASTREGWLYAWKTPANECVGGGLNADWRRFHGDERNTGFYGADTLPPATVADLRAYKTADATQFKLKFTAPGDNGFCGTAKSYDIRFVANPSVNLRSLPVWQTATAVDAPDPVLGRTPVETTVTAPGAAQFAMRAYDKMGLISWISNVAIPQDEPADDDASPDDDDDDDDDDNDSADDDDDNDNDSADDDATPPHPAGKSRTEGGCGC